MPGLTVCHAAEVFFEQTVVAENNELRTIRVARIRNLRSYEFHQSPLVPRIKTGSHVVQDNESSLAARLHYGGQIDAYGQRVFVAFRQEGRRRHASKPIEEGKPKIQILAIRRLY